MKKVRFVRKFRFIIKMAPQVGADRFVQYAGRDAKTAAERTASQGLSFSMS